MKPSFQSAAGNQRYSTGPLYSQRELRFVLQSMARDGYAKIEDSKTLGLGVYHRTENGVKTGEICLYLDTFGCHPNNSGTMFISENGVTRGSTVWEYAKEKRAAQGNPVTRLLKRMF